MPDPLEFYRIIIPPLKEPLNSLDPSNWKHDTDALVLVLISQKVKTDGKPDELHTYEVLLSHIRQLCIASLSSLVLFFN